MSSASHVADMTQEEGTSWSKVALALAIAVLFVGAGWWLVKSLKSDSGSPKRQMVKIAVLPDTPPPPPPKEEKKIEPEKKELQPQQQQDQPKQQDTPPEPQQLKMDGPAGDGPSAFASGQVNSEYKGGEIGTGTGGVNKMQFALFTNRLTRHIQAELARIKELKGKDYKVNVRIWLASDGSFQRVELVSPTGDEAQDAQFSKAMGQLSPIDQVPGNLPQPLTLRITNRVTG
jgi:protein TonB